MKKQLVNNILIARVTIQLVILVCLAVSLSSRNCDESVNSTEGYHSPIIDAMGSSVTISYPNEREIISGEVIVKEDTMIIIESRAYEPRKFINND